MRNLKIVLGSQRRCNVHASNISFTHWLISFQTAEDGIYEDIYRGITSDANNLVIENADGIKKVAYEKYAFISDVTILETEISNDCSISLIKERFYKTGFGLAVPEDWPYKKYFDSV